MRITTDEAYKYARTATIIVVTLFVTAVAVSYLSALPATIEQTWMINLSNTCGTKFETDSDGNFVVLDKFAQFFGSVIPATAAFFGPLGLYLGQLTFRYKGYGRLGKNAYSSRTGLEQIVYMLCIWALVSVPHRLNNLTYTTLLPMWTEVICMIAVPQFIFHFLITFLLPILTRFVMDYPFAKQDE